MDRQEQAKASDPQLERLRQYLRQRPDDGHAWLQLAQGLAGATPGPELHHAVEQAIRSLPEEPAPWRLAALLHERRTGAEAALRWLEGTVRQNPGLQAPRTVLAMLQGDRLRLQGRWEQALRHYREAQKAQPGDPVLLNNLGSCLASLDELADAEHCFRQALETNPGFAEARLNLGLLRALQGREEEALREIDAATGRPELAPPTRQAARALRALLAEHRRLAPAIAAAAEPDGIDALQRALDATPADLARPHEATVAFVRRLAGLYRDAEPLVLPAMRAHETAHLDLLEAFAHCKLPGGVAALARLRERLDQAPADTDDERRFAHILGVIRTRRGLDPGSLSGPAGEAWLRHWHARLLGPGPTGRPGQYKLSTNLVDGQPTTPAELVPGTLRALLREILPELPPGWRRGAFLYSAVNIVHGFGDGNGRLARFLLAWAAEAAGGCALVIPLELRTAAASALDAQRQGPDLRPQLALLREAAERNSRDLERLRDWGVRAPGPNT